MKELLLSLQDRLSSDSDLKYIDEDWGQLDDYGVHTPVKWPCCLIDFTAANYSDIGIDRASTPQNRQQATGSITLNFANLKLTNTSKLAPIGQKNDAWMLIELVEVAHGIIQGFRPSEKSGAMMRTSFRRIKRDDGIQQYQVVYTVALNNV